MSSQESVKDKQEQPKGVEIKGDKTVTMTDKERILLCEKMDKELDDFINSLERKRYTEGWSEDTWQEEMEKHPFFMKTTLDNGMSPLADGLANLKYDPAENTPNELANNYKEDGNFNYKHKNYRLSILGYTEGIKVRCPDDKINASLYNNRAAAHFHLKNYRSALQDCEKALNYDPEYTKCRMKAASCAYHLKQYDKTILHCTNILQQEEHKKEFLDSVLQLQCDAIDKKKVQDRDERRCLKQEVEQKAKDEAILKAATERKIRIADCWCNWSENELEKLMPEAEGGYKHGHSRTYMVSYDNGVLYWPVRLLYPEYNTTDLIKDAPEHVSLKSQLDEVFTEPPLWDPNMEYNCLSINVYFTGWNNKPHLVDINKTLGDILQMEFFEVRAGTPELYILYKGGIAEQTFLKEFH